MKPKPPLDTPRALAARTRFTLFFGRWSPRLALLVALAALGVLGWTLLHGTAELAPRKPSPAQAPARQMPADKPHMTLDPQLVS